MADALLIVSSALIDLFGVFLLDRWVFGGTCHPFLGLLILLGLRQMMQGLVALPAPPTLIWHDPGFPSLLITYRVANDYGCVHRNRHGPGRRCTRRAALAAR